MEFNLGIVNLKQPWNSKSYSWNRGLEDKLEISDLTLEIVNPKHPWKVDFTLIFCNITLGIEDKLE